MRHYGHAVQGRLTVKDSDVSVLKVPFNHETQFHSLRDFFAVNHEFQSYTLAIWSNDVERSRILFRAVDDEFLHFLDVPRSDFLGNRQPHCHVSWNTDLVDIEVRVWRNDRSRREINS